MTCCTWKTSAVSTVGTPHLEWHRLYPGNSKDHRKTQALSRGVMVLIFPSLNRKRIGGEQSVKCKQSHPAAFATVWRWFGSRWGASVGASGLHFPPPPPQDDGQLQAKKIFVSYKFICFPCQDHNSSFVTSPWTTVGGLGCHKQRILSQTGDSGSRIGKKEKKPKRPPFETKLLLM